MILNLVLLLIAVLFAVTEEQFIVTVPPALACDTSSAASTSGTLDTFLDTVQAGTSDNPFVMCLTASSISLTSQIEWSPPNWVVLKGNGSLTTTGGGDATILVDNYAVNASTIKFTLGAGSTFRMTAMTLRMGSGTNPKDNGMIEFSGNTTTPSNLRVDHFHWDMQTVGYGAAVAFFYNLQGVLDHSIMDWHANSAFYIHTGQGADGHAHAVWNTATGFGSGDRFLYLEDNQFNGDVTTVSSRVSDCRVGGKAVIRFNTLKYVAGGEIHATGSVADSRGCRAQESYGNLWGTLPGQPSSSFDMSDGSSGPSLVWGNTVGSGALSNFILLHNTRDDNTSYTQSATPTGWGYCGTAFNGTGSNWDRNDVTSTGYPCLDQPGRGYADDLLTGTMPTMTNVRTGTIAWPTQSLEPLYNWMITGTPSGGNFYAGVSSRVVSDRDYYQQASGVQVSSSSPFNGTTGVGWGTLANRPTTCTTGSETGGGVGYFATDQGSWNGSTSNPEGVQFSGADGELYKCTATNTWTAYYTPYGYPHPLNR